MLRPADTDWAHRGNSGVASSFDRPLSRTSLPLSSLRQENRIQQCSDKPQAHLGIPLSGIDRSWHFTSEVTPPDLDYDFIAATSCQKYLLLIQTTILSHAVPCVVHWGFHCLSIPVCAEMVKCRCPSYGHRDGGHLSALILCILLMSDSANLFFWLHHRLPCEGNPCWQLFVTNNASECLAYSLFFYFS